MTQQYSWSPARFWFRSLSRAHGGVTCAALRASEWETASGRERERMCEGGKERGLGMLKQTWQNIQKGDARRTMCAKFVPAGNRNVGSTVTRITPFHRGKISLELWHGGSAGKHGRRLRCLFFFLQKMIFLIGVRSDGSAYCCTRPAKLCLRCLCAFGPMVVVVGGNVCTPAPRQAVYTHGRWTQKKNKFAYTNYGCVEQSRCVECAFPSEA